MKGYILSIVITAMICAAANILLPPRSSAGQIIKLLSGVMLLLTVISPLTSISFQNISDYLQGISTDTDSFVAEGQIVAQEEINKIIKGKTEAYILDKANQMGLQIAVEVALDEDNYSIPSFVKVTGALSPYSKEILSGYIENTLGIAKEKQVWISKG